MSCPRECFQQLFLMAEFPVGAKPGWLYLCLSAPSGATDVHEPPSSLLWLLYLMSLPSAFEFLFSLSLLVIFLPNPYLSCPNLKLSNKYLHFGMPVYTVVSPAAWGWLFLNPQYSPLSQIIDNSKHLVFCKFSPQKCLS